MLCSASPRLRTAPESMGQLLEDAIALVFLGESMCVFVLYHNHNDFVTFISVGKYFKNQTSKYFR